MGAQKRLGWRPDGLDLVRRMLEQAPAKLKEQATILLELDPEQVPIVEKLAHELFREATTSVEKDLAHLDRIFIIDRRSEQS